MPNSKYNNHQLNVIGFSIVDRTVNDYDPFIDRTYLKQEEYLELVLRNQPTHISKEEAKGFLVVKTKDGEFKTIQNKSKYELGNHMVCRSFNLPNGKRCALLPVSTDFNGPTKSGVMPLLEDVLKNYQAYYEMNQNKGPGEYRDMPEEFILPIIERKQKFGEDHAVLVHGRWQKDGTLKVTLYDPKVGRFYDTSEFKDSIKSAFFQPAGDQPGKGWIKGVLDFFKNLFKKDEVNYKVKGGWGHQQIVDTDSCGMIVGTYIEDICTGKKVGETFDQILSERNYQGSLEKVCNDQYETAENWMSDGVGGYMIGEVFLEEVNPELKGEQRPSYDPADVAHDDDFDMSDDDELEDPAESDKDVMKKI